MAKCRKFSLLIENEVNNFPTHVRFNHLKYMMDNFFNDEEEKKLMMMMMMMKMLKAVRILKKEVTNIINFCIIYDYYKISLQNHK